MTPTQTEIWETVACMLSVRETIGPSEVARRVYRGRSSIHAHLATFRRAGLLQRVPIGATGKKGRYTLAR